METENTIKGPSILDRTRITLKEAIRRAAAWRDLLVTIPPSTDAEGNITTGIPPQRVFRAININMADIDQLKKDHPEAGSIRLYMSLPDPKYPFNICGMLVPVDGNNNDMLVKADSLLTMTQEQILEDAGASTIYDFTSPCPNLCDPKSPLFNAANSVESYI